MDGKGKNSDETKLLSYDVDKDTDNPERMFHIGRKVVNYWDISEDLGYVILSVNLDELESVLSAGKGSRVYLVKDGVIVGAEDTKMLGGKRRLWIVQRLIRRQSKMPEAAGQSSYVSRFVNIRKQLKNR